MLQLVLLDVEIARETRNYNSLSKKTGMIVAVSSHFSPNLIHGGGGCNKLSPFLTGLSRVSPMLFVLENRAKVALLLRRDFSF